MLTYLQGTTRHYIAMVVHYCVRFSVNPKLSHESEMKQVGRNLSGNKDREMVLKPDKNMKLQCYVDADFAGE